MYRYLRLALGLAGLGQALLLGQQPVAPPIAISSAQLSPTDGSVVLTLSNQAAKKIRAYVLKLEFPDKAGGVAFRGSEMRLTGLGPPPARDGFAPNETWTHKIRLAAAPHVVPGVTVDYVVFSDGSTSGIDSMGQAQKIRGVEEGWSTAVANLKRLLNEEGPQAVVDYLNRVQ